MPEFISNVLKLIEAATRWLLLIIPGACTLFYMYLAWRKSMTEDDAYAEKLGRSMKNTIIYGAIATGASGIVTTILSFF